MRHLVPPASRQRAIDVSGGTPPDTPSTSTDLAISNSSAAEVDGHNGAGANRSGHTTARRGQMQAIEAAN
jgi:hypothetical protein